MKGTPPIAAKKGESASSKKKKNLKGSCVLIWLVGWCCESRGTGVQNAVNAFSHLQYGDMDCLTELFTSWMEISETDEFIFRKHFHSDGV